MEADSNGLFVYNVSSTSKLIVKLVIDPDFLEEGNDKELRMIRCRLKKVLKPEHNLSKLFLCLFLQDQFNMDKSKLNWGLMSGIYPVA